MLNKLEEMAKMQPLTQDEIVKAVRFATSSKLPDLDVIEKTLGTDEPLTLQDRCDLYRARFPDFPAPVVESEKRIEGLWMMGNCYQTSGYYGAYPHGYLDRIMSMFPEAKPETTLHVPSGSLPPGIGLRIDIRPECNPDIVGDCHDIKALVGDRRFDLILADPPYSAEDAEHYGKPMVSRAKMLRSCLDVCKPGGWIIWLDQVLPMHCKDQVDWALAIGMVKSTNHRVRGVFGFRKKEAGK